MNRVKMREYNLEEAKAKSVKKELITKWLQKGKTITEIAEDLDQSEEYVKSLICSQE